MNKLTKLLSVFVIAGAIGTGVAGAAGCAHKHTYSDEWTSAGAEGHYHMATCKHTDEHDEIKPHTWDNDQDTTCNDCGYTRTVDPGTPTPTPTPGPSTGEDDEKQYETVTTTVDFTKANAATGGTVGNDGYVYAGKFTFTSGMKFEPTKNSSTKYNGATQTGCVNTQGKTFTVTLTGRTNSLIVWGEGASSGSASITVYKGDANGEKLGEKLNVSNGVAADGLEFTNLAAGTYTVVTQGSFRLYKISISEELETSAKSSITVSGAVSKFLKGREFNYNGLSVTLNYENGRTDSIDVTANMVDSSAVDMETAGKYTVKVKYHDTKDDVDFEDTYEVAVYEIKSIALEMYDLDSSRVTKNVQQVFAKSSTFSSANLGVVATAICPGIEAKEEFVLSAATGNEEYSISGGDTATAGAKTVTVAALDKATATTTYGIQVVDGAFAELSAYEITVDKTAAFAVDAAAGTATVNTINQALQLLKLGTNVKDTADKTIKIKAGEYKEKVEVDIPNVHLVGDISGEQTNKDVVIWNDVLALTVAHGGVAHSTDGSATVSIRSKATGFTAKDLTFKNYYNTNALYEESKKLGANTQAVALLADCDRITFENCFFTSYHDTLYAMNGRQVYESCEIEGRTDYIFGDKATAYFHNCTVNTIGADDSKNGGYIVATKGSGVEYGYIFDGCTFGADEHVTAGTVSLARGWDTGMRLMFMNSEFSDAYSLEYYGEATKVNGETAKDNKNDRYTKMNAEPNPAQLFEYNNTGAGALTEAIIATKDSNGKIDKMCTIPTAEVAAKFADFSVIFAQTNGSVKYDTAWAGSNERITVSIDVEDMDNLTVSVYKNVKLTKEIAEELFEIEEYKLTGLYTDAARQTEFEYGTALTEGVTLYATYEEADPTIRTSINYVYGNDDSHNHGGDDDGAAIDKIKKVTCSDIVVNNSWARWKDDNASISFTALKGTVITFTVNGGETLVFNTDEVAATDDKVVTYTVPQDGVVTIKRKAGTNAYFRTLSIQVPVTETVEYDYTADDRYAKDGSADGTAVEGLYNLTFTNMNVNNSWLKFGSDAGGISFIGVKDTIVTIDVYNGTSGLVVTNGVAVNEAEAGEDGVILKSSSANTITFKVAADGLVTIKRQASNGNSYLSKIKVAPPITSVTYTYTYGGDNAAVWSTAGNPATTVSTDATPVTALKLEPEKSLNLAATGTKATVSATGFTTSSSNASKFLKIDFLDANGGVVGTLEGTTPAGKVNGAYTFDSNTVTTSAEFVSVKVYCGTSGKGTGIVTLSIVVE